MERLLALLSDADVAKLQKHALLLLGDSRLGTYKK